MRNLLLILLVVYSIVTYGQIRQFKDYNLSYVSFTYGKSSGNYTGSNYLGVGFRSKLLGNFGIEGTLGNYNVINQGVRDLWNNDNPSQTTCNLCVDYRQTYFRWDQGLNFGLNIDYRIEISSKDYGVIPKVGLLWSKMENVEYDASRVNNSPWTYSLNTVNDNYFDTFRGNLILGLDILIKNLVLGVDTMDGFFNGYRVRIGYVLKNELKKL